MTSSSKPVGELLGETLAAKGLSQSALSRTVGTSQGYISTVVSGANQPTPGWLDVVASAMNLSPTETVELHRAAARSRGFKIDLT